MAITKIKNKLYCTFHECYLVYDFDANQKTYYLRCPYNKDNFDCGFVIVSKNKALEYSADNSNLKPSLNNWIEQHKLPPRKDCEDIGIHKQRRDDFYVDENPFDGHYENNFR